PPRRDPRGHQAFGRAQYDQVLEGEEQLAAGPAPGRKKTVAREASHLRDGQSQHLGDVSGGISLHPSELRSRTSYLALRDGRGLGSLTLDALRGLALAGRARRRSLALEARLARFRQVDNLRLRRLGRCFVDCLALHLT